MFVLPKYLGKNMSQKTKQCSIRTLTYFDRSLRAEEFQDVSILNIEKLLIKYTQTS